MAIAEKAFNEMPYNGRMSVIALRNWIATMLDKYEGVINESSFPDTDYCFVDRTGQFSFRISQMKPHPQTGDMSARVIYTPGDLKSMAGQTMGGNIDGIKMAFDTWIEIVKKMHEASDEYFNPDKKFYDEEFEDFLRNDDEDAAYKPYGRETQDLIHHFLNYAELTVEKATDIPVEKKEEIVSNIKILRENLPTFTKKKVVKFISKIAQNVKMVSDTVFHQIFDVLKSELIAAALFGAIPQIPKAIEAIQTLIQHLLH